jgi:predicted HAD superfamily Cof-like phosphohydrolase
MKQPESLEMVAQFHNTFKHPVLNTPTIPDSKRCELRVSLIAEELDELREAIEDNDMVEIADALCDIQYVLSGAILEFGLADKFNALFTEVQRSNMSKACRSEEEAKATAEYFLKEKGEECYYKQEGDLFLVYRKSDNKTMKSINYSPADLKSIVES